MLQPFRTHSRALSPVLLSSLLLSSIASGAQAQPACAPPIDPFRSLVVTDAALDRAKFSFVNTTNAILTSLNIATTPENRENFVRSLITSFNADDMVNPVSGLRMKVDIRPLEAAMDPKKLLDPIDPIGLVPIALFNRLDLAPQDWSNCGEHRIVYSFKAPVPNTSGPPSRFFLIFEARVNNASPQQSGFEGCRPVADFWRNLSDENDVATRAARLEEFYYKGLSGVSGPVVQARNYGGPLGQVRGNIFMNAPGTPPLWQLREWIVINSGLPTPASFVPVSVKENPLAELYADANGPNTLDAALEATERTEFQKQFNNLFITRLLEPDVVREFLTSGQTGYVAELDPKSPQFDVGKYKIDIINRIGARFENRFNEFQSVSQTNEDDPFTIATTSGPIFKGRVATATAPFALDPAQKPNADHVLNRAGAVTCGGCHQFSGGGLQQQPARPIGLVNGQPIDWPASAIFVHVVENSTLSPALNNFFLPFRADRLRDAVCIEAPPVAVAADPARRLSAEAAGIPRALAFETARQARWQQLVRAARDQKDEAVRQAVTREAVQAISVQRQEEIQKPGFFVTNRRPH